VGGDKDECALPPKLVAQASSHPPTVVLTPPQDRPLDLFHQSSPHSTTSSVLSLLVPSVSLVLSLGQDGLDQVCQVIFDPRLVHDACA